MAMTEVMYKGLHKWVSLGETGLYIDHNMHSEWRALTYFLYPGMATTHPIISIQPTNALYCVQFMKFPNGLIQR